MLDRPAQAGSVFEAADEGFVRQSGAGVYVWQAQKCQLDKAHAAALVEWKHNDAARLPQTDSQSAGRLNFGRLP